MQIGYARGYTLEKDLRLKYDALNKARYDKIYIDNLCVHSLLSSSPKDIDVN